MQDEEAPSRRRAETDSGETPGKQSLGLKWKNTSSGALHHVTAWFAQRPALFVSRRVLVQPRTDTIILPSSRTASNEILDGRKKCRISFYKTCFEDIVLQLAAPRSLLTALQRHTSQGTESDTALRHAWQKALKSASLGARMA